MCKIILHQEKENGNNVVRCNDNKIDIFLLRPYNKSVRKSVRESSGWSVQGKSLWEVRLMSGILTVPDEDKKELIIEKLLDKGIYKAGNQQLYELSLRELEAAYRHISNN